MYSYIYHYRLYHHNYQNLLQIHLFQIHLFRIHLLRYYLHQNLAGSSLGFAEEIFYLDQCFFYGTGGVRRAVGQQRYGKLTAPTPRSAP